LPWSSAHQDDDADRKCPACSNELPRLLYDVKRRSVQHLTVHTSPERSRRLMDVSIEAENTLASGPIFRDLGPEPSKS